MYPMKKIFYLCAAAACCVQASAPASAAPLDAFLSANQNGTPWSGEAEASYDVANDTVDVFHIREKDAATSTSKLGDYQGAHLHGGVALTPRLWLDGSYWQRKITSRNFEATVKTWQVAAQYKLIDSAGYRPSLALRVGAWGNSADQLKREKNIKIGSTVLKSASLSGPEDQQYQVDLIGSWPVSERTELGMFAGAGHSRVTFDTASATTTRDGCLYNLSFGPSRVVGTCETPSMSARFSTPNSVYGIDVNQEAQYSARYYQVGLNAKWQAENLRLRAGYQYLSLSRGNVDSIVGGRGGIAYKKNHILTAEVAYKLFKHTSVFLRGQYMSNQFNGEMPMAYNTLTASNFNQRYGILSTGVITTF